MTSRSNALGGSSGASLLEALHWEHPPLKQRVGEVSGFRTQHENLRGVLQTVLSDDDRSAVAEVMEVKDCGDGSLGGVSHTFRSSHTTSSIIRLDRCPSRA